MRPTKRIPLFALLILALLGASVARLPLAAQEGCIAPLPITIGDLVTVVGGVYIRQTPDLDGGIISYAPERIGVRVIGGPSCADGTNWWQVQRLYEAPTFQSAWVSEGLPAREFILLNAPIATPVTCAPPVPVVQNQSIALFTGARVRETPSRTARVLTVAPIESVALLLDGPVCADGYNWWNIEVTVLTITYRGWIVEGVPSGTIRDVTVIDDAPDAGPESIACGVAAPLNVGDRGVLRFTAESLKALRAAPITDGELLYRLPSGITLEILSGPFCNEGVNWRQVRVFGGSITAEGWLAEGDALGRFIQSDGYAYGYPPAEGTATPRP
ncbi:MAG: SH3 domain-containing protein [Phototrophicaceae bacterium]|jgi:hypothetical protein